MTLDREALRPAFEAWYKDRWPRHTLETSEHPGEEGQYINEIAQHRFEGWCAATERLLSDEAVERGGEALGRNALSSCDDHTRRNNARVCIIAAITDSSIGKEG